MASGALEESYLLLIKFVLFSKRHMVELAAKDDLTAMQAMMLFLLDEPRPMSSFKKIFNCDASNITGLVDGLEEKKLAARFSNPSDRRVKMVKLSPKGSRLRHKLLSRLARQDGSILSKLQADELKTFTALLAKITNGSAVL